jgi:ubiquinol-cytochrome c reductase cytochrome c subunit
VVAVVPAVVVGACSYFDDPEPYRPSATYPRSDVESAALGGTLYRRDCGFCHGAEGQGTERGPDLVSGPNGPALTDFMLRTGRMPIDDADDEVRRGTPEYDEAEIDALVAYLDETLDQPGPAIPDVSARGGDLALGQRLYQQHCAACHATTGIGGAMLAQEDPGRSGRDGGGGDMTGVYIPDLSDSTPVEVGEAVRTGPGAMPRFGPGVLDDGELDATVRYVEDLRDPDDRGGAPIGRVGPVAEGAVGWLIGLGLLVLFIRWIGTKRGEQT